MEELNTQQNIEDLQHQEQSQKRALFWGVVIASAFAVFWGVFVFNNRVYSFSDTLLSLGSSLEDDQETLNRLESLSALQLEDTDGDGLNDFQERFETNTSEFLADTDGDGVSDFDEINNGDDPNCAEGNDCGVRLISETADGVDLTASEEDIESFIAKGDLTADELRTELVKIGIPQETVDQATDEELQAVYATVREQYLAANPEVDTSPANRDASDDIALEDVQQEDGFESLLLEETAAQDVLSSVSSVSDLANLNAQQVRQLLTEGGIDASQLEGLSDDELLSLYQQALSEQSSQ